MQCFGGHGYISEWGVEQNVRDARIAMLYEGTTGIQALDLLGRKVLGSRGKSLEPVTGFILDFCKRCRRRKEIRPYVKTVVRLTRQWRSLTRKIGFAAMQNRDAVGAASVDYIMFSGYVLLGVAWAASARAAYRQARAGHDRRGVLSCKDPDCGILFRQDTATHHVSSGDDIDWS